MLSNYGEYCLENPMIYRLLATADYCKSLCTCTMGSDCVDDVSLSERHDSFLIYFHFASVMQKQRIACISNLQVYSYLLKSSH